VREHRPPVDDTVKIPNGSSGPSVDRLGRPTSEVPECLETRTENGERGSTERPLTYAAIETQ
jgi:hypothetical protein